MYLLQWWSLCALVAVAAGANGAVGVEGVVDVESTVRRVQALLRANSLLPRLSRREILDLLHDIRAEDARAPRPAGVQAAALSTDSPRAAAPRPAGVQAAALSTDSPRAAAQRPAHAFDSTTEKDEASMLVVLPYTPRDGYSLQELYTKPPKVEKVPLVPAAAPAPAARGLPRSRLHAALTHNARLADARKEEEFPAELQAFLSAHGLRGGLGRDHFLLPLEGFKPLPPANVVDGDVQLPENILLTYELLPARDGADNQLRDLHVASSETEETVYPLQMPAALTKGNLLPLNYEPVEYDAIKVIPLNKGISPEDESKVSSGSEHSKRQANGTESVTSTAAPESGADGMRSEGATAAAGDSATDSANDSAVDSANDSAVDSGASLADLESSFGGAAPAQPGDAELPPPRKNGFYWMVDWNSFLEVGDGDSKVNIRFEPKLGDPQMFLPVSVP